MRKINLTLFVLCATLLWVGAAHASNAGGLPACKAKLDKCDSDLFACDGSLSTCDSNLSSCNTDLNTCTNKLSAAQAFPATGQTTSYAAGDDGAIRAGAVLSYTDNGDGTISDNNTKLTWEKKDQAGGLHDVNNVYPWSGVCQDNLTLCGTNADCSGLSGTALCKATDGQGTGLTIFQYAAKLNTEAFAGHNDWRVPNVKELESIVDFQTINPVVAAVFSHNCLMPCTVLTCSCTQLALYWSSTTLADNQLSAWIVDFTGGTVGIHDKIFSSNAYVRAVRGGL